MLDIKPSIMIEGIEILTVDKGVKNAHCAVGNTSVGVDLLED